MPGSRAQRTNRGAISELTGTALADGNRKVVPNLMHKSRTPPDLTPADLDVAPAVSDLLAYLGSDAELAVEPIASKAMVPRNVKIGHDRLDAVLDVLLPREVPPTSQAATPVADGHRWRSMIDDDVKAAFFGGVRYMQNLHDGFGPARGWQQTFELADREAAEHVPAESDVGWSWQAHRHLSVTQVRSAMARHPRTGAAELPESTVSVLATALDVDELPKTASFADGSAIPAEYVPHIQDLGMAVVLDVNWSRGDLLLIDNFLAHGRVPFEGQARILVTTSGQPSADADA
jgi:Taurine catabolism dioxygenase TauD, TfdA family